MSKMVNTPRGKAGLTDSHNRRERILNAAREMLIDGGPDAVSMRDLAAAADVSVPTLYNQFGSKNGILAAAMQELHYDAIDRIRKGGEKKGFEHLLAILKGLRQEMATIPVFARSTLQLYITWPEESDHRLFTDVEFSEGYAVCLGEIAAADELDPRIDINGLASQLNRAVMYTASEWAFGRMSLDDFVNQSGESIAYLLYGITRGETQKSVERYLGLKD